MSLPLNGVQTPNTNRTLYRGPFLKKNVFEIVCDANCTNSVTLHPWFRNANTIGGGSYILGNSKPVNCSGRKSEEKEKERREE